jgi:hypothetical protein
VLSSLDPKYRLILAILLFLLVTVFGLVCLVMTGRVIPPL